MSRSPEPGALRVEAVGLRRLEIELTAAHGTATGTHRRHPVLLVHVEPDGSEGDGEFRVPTGRGRGVEVDAARRWPPP